MGELMAIAQQHRRIAISSPLGKDVLLLRGFSGSEAISQLFHFDLDLLSENDSIKFQDVVGKSVTLRIYDPDGKERQDAVAPRDEEHRERDCDADGNGHPRA